MMGSIDGVEPYRLAQVGGRAQFMAPDGRAFWSLGVNCTDMGETPEKWTASNPSYSGLKLFPTAEAWTQDTITQLTGAGFNSLGGWSDADLFAQYGGSRRMPYFLVLHLGAYNRAPWRDQFTKENAEIIDKAARDQIERRKDDPYLVGYFSDNELGWWREALFKTYVSLPADAPGKQRLVDFTRRFYRNDFTRMQRDWTGVERDFYGMNDRTRLRPGGNGMALVRDWQTYVTADYYRKMRDAIRRYDRRRLILGDRYCQFYYPNVARSARPFVDAISTNYGADWTDGQNTEYFLATLHRATGKPVIITEFYMAAMENRSGNRNSSGGFPVVQTQREREDSVRTYLADLGRRGYVAGAHWFQFYDEPTHGRGDGENYNMGLVDIHGEFYKGLMDVFRAFQPTSPEEPKYDAELPEIAPDAATQLNKWPRRAALVKPRAGDGFADLYVGRQGDDLLVGLASMGFTDESLYPDGRVPEGDRTRLTMRINGRTVWVRFGGKDRPCTLSLGAELVAFQDGVRGQLAIRIPGAATDRLRVSATLETHGRGDRMAWQDARTLASDR